MSMSSEEPLYAVKEIKSHRFKRPNYEGPELEIQWDDDENPSWEPFHQMMLDIEDMVREYASKNMKQFQIKQDRNKGIYILEEKVVASSNSKKLTQVATKQRKPAMSPKKNQYKPSMSSLTESQSLSGQSSQLLPIKALLDKIVQPTKPFVPQNKFSNRQNLQIFDQIQNMLPRKKKDLIIQNHRLTTENDTEEKINQSEIDKLIFDVTGKIRQPPTQTQTSKRPEIGKNESSDFELKEVDSTQFTLKSELINFKKSKKKEETQKQIEKPIDQERKRTKWVDETNIKVIKETKYTLPKIPETQITENEIKNPFFTAPHLDPLKEQCQVQSQMQQQHNEILAQYKNDFMIQKTEEIQCNIIIPKVQRGTDMEHKYQNLQRNFTQQVDLADDSDEEYKEMDQDWIDLGVKPDKLGYTYILGQPWEHTPKRILAQSMHSYLRDKEWHQEVYCLVVYEDLDEKTKVLSSWVPQIIIMTHFCDLHVEYVNKYMKDQLNQFQSNKRQKLIEK